VRPVSLGSLRGEVASAQRQVSFLRLTSVPVDTQGDYWLSQVPVLPSRRMPCSWTPVVLRHSPWRTVNCCLPSLVTGSAFPPFRRWLSYWSTTFGISGLYHTACFLATPGLVPTIADDARGFASELLARLCSGGSWLYPHPLGNYDEFLACAFPSSRACLARHQLPLVGFKNSVRGRV
jgi:hypothetical protein